MEDEGRKDDFSRRDFLLKTSIIGILASLGLPVLEQVVGDIMRRIADLNGNSEFARMIADNLSHEAFATLYLCDNGTEPYLCSGTHFTCEHDFVCDPDSDGTRFDCLGSGFTCSDNNDCNTNHRCLQGFDCSTTDDCLTSHACGGVGLPHDCATFDCANAFNCIADEHSCSCSNT